jgi:ABC-2 type transport system permease protein
VRLREVFRYELGYRLRAGATWAYAGILFALAFFFMAGPGSDGAGFANAPDRVADFTAIAGTFGMLVTAALFGDAAVRDVQAGMDPLVFTTPVTRGQYLGGRFLAAFAANALVAVAIPLGLLAYAHTLPDAGEVGPFRAAAYVQPYLLLLLPNVAVVGAILFAVAARARQIVPVYLAAVAIFIATLVGLNHREQIAHPALRMLADPLGMGTMRDATALWTLAERNTRLVALPETLLWNRLLWLAIGAAVLLVLLRAFRFAHPDGGSTGRRRRPGEETVPEPRRDVPLSVPRVAGAFGARTTLRQTLAVGRQAFAETVSGRTFAAVLLGTVVLSVLMSWDVGESVFDTSTWPVTFLVAETALSERIVPVLYVVLVVFAGELVWKDRELGVAEIADAAPVPEGVALLGRYGALVALLATLQAGLMAGGMLVQALQGYVRFEPLLYVRILFGLNLSDLALLAALAMALHVAVNHRYVGHFLALIACVGTVVAPLFGLRHNLLVYAGDPGWTYSDMNGFGPFVGPVVWFRLYWAAWALLLGVAATLLWVRGREPGVRGRLRTARGRMRGGVVRAAGVAVALIGSLGGFLYYNTNVLNDYASPAEAGRAQAEYERRYGRFRDAPQPTVVAADLRVELHPDQGAADLRGSYRLENRTGAPLDAVHVVLDADLEARALSLDRPSRPALTDGARGFRIFRLDRPLAPGDSVRLAFDLSFRPRGFPNEGARTEVVRAGANLDRRWLPFIGYQPVFELEGQAQRARFGLPPRPPLPGPDDARAMRRRSPIRNEDRVAVEMVIGTAEDQTALTPGTLRRTWTEGGRRWFHYASEAPISFGGPVFSGRYAVREDRWGDVALRVHHHPAHTENLDRTVRGMKASLAYYTRSFGPYPDRQLRIVELPRYGGFGVAHPHTVTFTEDYFLACVRPGELDQPFYGTAHEVAHQWWGGMVRGAAVRGHGFLSESLANYSALMVTERTYGPAAARRIYDFQMQRYLAGRARQSREVPLLEVEDQPYIAYRKGAVALYTLRERIGEERVSAALRRYVARYRDAGPPYPTSRDLFAELVGVTPAGDRQLLTDWFETVTLWDVRTTRATVSPLSDGRYEVTTEVVGRKMRADRDGNETEVPMDDLVEIGVFAAGEGDSLGAPLHLRRHRIRGGAQTIRVVVPRMPARAGIDPHRKLIDRRRDDNLADVEGGASAPPRARRSSN